METLFFSIGDMVGLIDTGIVGIIIGEKRETERYRVGWLNTRGATWERDASWVSYDRLERISQ